MSLTKQELFNQVAQHLLTQGCKSITAEDGGDLCLYRGPNGTKCAIGVLIPDEAYLPGYEKRRPKRPGTETNDVMARLLTAAANLTDENYDTAIRLQTVHDTVEVVRWPRRLIEEARQLGLNSDVVVDYLLDKRDGLA